MKVLLDTHIALWTLLDSEKMPIEARNLIAQAKAEGIILLTHDSLLAGYNEPCVMTV